MENSNYCVYMHINKVNGKKYCGITSQKPEYRWRQGSGYEHNTYFYNAILKYGWDGFIHLILYDDVSLEEARRIEQKYIADFDLTNPSFGYNLTKGGEGTLGYHHTEEAKQKMSQSKTGHICDDSTRQKISEKNSGSKNGMFGAVPWNKGREMPKDVKEKVSKSRKGKCVGEAHPMYGKKHSEQSIKKMSDSHKGHTAWNKGIHTGIKPGNVRKVCMYNDDGVLLKEFQSIADAAREVNGCSKNISACCSGRVKHASGYVWRYCDEQ